MEANELKFDHLENLKKLFSQFVSAANNINNLHHDSTLASGQDGVMDKNDVMTSLTSSLNSNKQTDSSVSSHTPSAGLEDVQVVDVTDFYFSSKNDKIDIMTSVNLNQETVETPFPSYDLEDFQIVNVMDCNVMPTLPSYLFHTTPTVISLANAADLPVGSIICLQPEINEIGGEKLPTQFNLQQNSIVNTNFRLTNLTDSEIGKNVDCILMKGSKNNTQMVEYRALSMGFLELKLRSSNKANMFVQTSDQGKKLLPCIYCKNLQTKLGRHLSTIHKNEAEVQELNLLPTGSVERKAALDILKKKGVFEWNTNPEVNKT
ncbi:hypothetical protein Bhyg_13947, partial [Pseudolycoriella hygida]